MSAYRFRLATVLRLRERDEELARERLVRARQEVAAAEARVAGARAEAQRLAGSTAGTTVASLHRHRYLAGAAARGVAALEAELARCRAEAAARADEWSAAAARVRGLERLDERRRAEHDAEERRRQQREDDETASVRSARGRAS